LLSVLNGINILNKFYTTLATNPYARRIEALLPFRWKRLLQKRYYGGIRTEQIAQCPLVFVFPRVLLGFKIDLGLLPYRYFDRWVAKKLKRESFDIIIGYENANLNTFAEAKKTGKTTILDLAAVHHIQNQLLWENFPAYQKYIGERSAFEKMNADKARALTFTDYCFCLSEYARSTLIRGGYPADRIFVTYLGTDMLGFFDAKIYPERNERALQLIFVGTISLLKGVDVLFEVMSRLVALPIRLLLVGPVDPNAQLLDKLPSNCTYRPFLFREELGSALLGADVFVTGSYTDSWAQTVIEAMACGTPVIVSQNTGAKEAVEQGGGFVVPVGAVEAYVEKILFFYENRDEIERMGRRARQIASQYTWDNYHSQVEAALREIAKRENIVW